MGRKNPTIFEIVRPYDPVLRAHVAVTKAVEYGRRRHEDFRAFFELPDGARPTVFRCKALSLSQQDALDTVSIEKQRWKLAFCMSLLEVVDVDVDGKLKTWRPTRVEPEEPLGSDALDELVEMGFGRKDFHDVGAAVEELSTVGKGVPAYCPLPDTSLRAWDSQSLSRRAERKTDDETHKG